jgi:hypothetical protein
MSKRKQYREVTFGADPEVFVQNAREIVPACGLFGGGKGAPILLSPDGGYLEDGVTVEFNVSPSSTFPTMCNKLMGLIDVFLAQHNGYKIVLTDSWEFPKAQLAPHPQAYQIGCAGDLWAYGIRKAPQINDFKNWRFAGGHIHLGIEPKLPDEVKVCLVPLLDLAVLVPQIKYCGPSARFVHYGFPGIYRSTSYGIEYRSPASYWIYDKGSYGVQVAERLEALKMWVEQLPDDALEDIPNRVNKYFSSVFNCHFDRGPKWSTVNLPTRDNVIWWEAGSSIF